jgi:PAS domain S-box-containing protein
MTERIRVLHVDDRPDFSELTATALEREDERLTVETATSASEGLDRLTDATDCVVSDYEMPDRNGIDFLEAVRDRYPDLPFVLFTGKGSEEVASEAISAGVTDYLEKGGGLSQFTVLANRIANAVEQYRSKGALEASERRLSLFFEQSPLGVVEWNESFEVVRVNDAATEILGYDEVDLIGASWKRIVPESEREAVGATVDALLEDRGGYRSVNENVRPDGERIVCEWHNWAVTDDGGDVVAIFSQFQEVTDRVERERRLERTTARLEALFENSPDMINVHDLDGNVIEPNPRLCEKTGYDAAELAEMKVWDLDESIDPDEVRGVWERMTPGDRRRLDGVYRRADGSTFPVEVHVQRIEMAGQDRFVVVSRDVSRRTERERDLKATKERLDTIVSNVPVVLFALDADGVFTLSEGRGLAALGLEPGEMVGRSALDLYADYPAVTDRIERALDGEEVDAVLEIDDRWFEVAYQPVVGADGDVSRVIGVATDVTERRRREREIERQNDRLEAFVGVVSHDLRSPLNVAAGRLELARERHDDDCLDEAARALDRMDRLIDDLLRLARDGERAVEVEAVSLADAVGESWRDVAAADAELVVETVRTIRADRRRLRHLLVNLLQNAVEHGRDSTDRSSKDGAPTVTVGDLPGGAGFYVADDGPGIPAAERERVFRDGYSTTAEGTGFGLAIVETVAETHGWEVEVGESASGGARFELTGVDVVD